MFHERLRTGLRRYRGGVHEESAGANARELAAAEARLGPLPPGVADLYSSWNGLGLFHDTVLLRPLEALARDGEVIALGEANGAPLYLDRKGRVLVEDEGGERVVTGSTVERYLEAVLAREALLLDRDGEWRDVFDAGDLKPEVQKKRVAAGLKADPESAAWHLEAAELAFDGGDDAAAESSLARAVELDRDAAPAWTLLGSLQRRAQRHADAARSLSEAARATQDPARRAERAAEAARAFASAGDESARASHAAQALAASPGTVASWSRDAAARLTEGDSDGALNLATLAAAVQPSEETNALVARARARARMKLL